MRVSTASNATTLAVRRDSAVSSACSPKQSPAPSTASVATSPSGVDVRTATRPFCTMWKLSPRSPSKNNVSPFLNDRRVIRATTSRRSSSLSPPSMSFTIASL